MTNHDVRYRLVKQRSADRIPDDDEKAAAFAVSVDKDAPVATLLRAMALKAQDEGNWGFASAFWQGLSGISPDDAEAWFGLGYSNHNLWRKELYVTALDVALTAYAKTVELSPDYVAAFCRWGTALAEKATLTAEGDELYEAAYNKFQRATAINPDDHDIYNGWGATLLSQSQVKVDDEAVSLIEEACSQFQQGVEVGSNEYPAYNNWSNALLQLAQRGDASKKDDFLRQAAEKGLFAEGLKPGGSAYNLACIYVSLGNEGEARNWLYQARDSGALPGCYYLEQDKDLAAVRETAWFQTLLKESCADEIEMEI